MNFISWSFFFLFLQVLAYRLFLGQDKTKWHMTFVVLLGSTIFVMWHVPIYILIMLTSIIVDYYAAQWIMKEARPLASKRLILYTSLSINLGLLIFFKYTNFFLDSATYLLANTLAYNPNIPRLELILPMGISFYTFCSMSYTIDIYRGKLPPLKRFQDFYYFVTFFPHLVAGPIIRAGQFFYQLPRKRTLNFVVFSEGAFLIIRGLFLKMVCADNIGTILKPLWKDEFLSTAPALYALEIVIMFSAQIFYDFEGYTSIARGLAYWMGYKFPINFKNPYLAHSFSNFWQRWHISLSSWLRDYVYVSLGGNRGTKLKIIRNLIIIMLLVGLWHGAAATFLIWGAIHGLGLGVERWLGLNSKLKIGIRPAYISFLWFLSVQAVVLIAWVFFRSSSMHQAVLFLHCFLRVRSEVPVPIGNINLLLLVPIVAMHLYGLRAERSRRNSLNYAHKAALTGALLAATLLFYGTSNDFIYFQF